MNPGLLSRPLKLTEITGTFVISQLMGGGKVPLIGDIIQNQFGKSSDWHFGSTLSLLVMVVVLAFMGGLQRIDKEEEPRKEVRIL